MKYEDAKNTIIMAYPASWWGGRWRDATPLGNGITGAGVYGSVNHETIAISRTNMWTNDEGREMPDVAETFAASKKLFEKGEYGRAIPLTVNAMRAKGFTRNETYPVPLADLHIETDAETGFYNYRRLLNMATGEATIQWSDNGTNYERKQFVSREGDIIAVKVVSTKPFSANIYLTPHSFNDSVKPYNLNNKVESLPLNFQTSVLGSRYCYEIEYCKGKFAGAMIDLRCDGEKNISTDSILLNNITCCEMFIKCFDHNALCEVSDVLTAFFDISAFSYETLLNIHAKKHYNIYGRSQLDLGANRKEREKANELLLLEAYKGHAPVALIEKMALFGKYLMVSASSTEGGNPCTLTGLWNFEYDAFWSINMANENVQVIYWHTLPSNMPEQMRVLLSYYERGMPEMQKVAKNIFGCRGIFLPSDTTPGVWTFRSDATHLLYWTGGAAWISQFFYDYFEYTLDYGFLEKHALPFMRQAALFYEDFVSYDQNGKIIFAPSVSPENAPNGYDQPLRNATMDFALLKDLLKKLIKGSRLLGVYEKDVLIWQKLLSAIPDYMINEDGAVKEWMTPELGENYNHRHLSHIYPLFPGDEITEGDPLYGGFCTALKKREIGVSAQASWSFVHISSALARIGDAEGIFNNFNNMARFCVMSNLFTVHNDWRNMGISLGLEHAPFQIDGNTGLTNVVYDMIVYSGAGFIRILPALHEQFRKGYIKNFLCKGQITGSIKWNRGVNKCELKLESAIDQTIDIDMKSGLFLVGTDAVYEKQEKTYLRHVFLQKNKIATFKFDFKEEE